MKNYFIINPISGKENGQKYIEEAIELLDEKIKQTNQFYLLTTSKPADATNIAKKIGAENQDENINLFACGGDGTCFEVLNGIIDYPKVHFGIIPIGSCNDFLKTFSDYDFTSIEKQLEGTATPIDVIKVNNEYALNVVNFGFDAKVNNDQMKLRKKIKKISKAYNIALLKNALSLKKAQMIDLYVDNELFYHGKMLLANVANAKFYGGGYQCAPLASVEDGLFDVLVVKKISLFKFIRLVKYYKQGLHLSLPKFNKILLYKQGQQIRLVSNQDVVGCFDGETKIAKEFKLELLASKINFIIPSNK